MVPAVGSSVSVPAPSFVNPPVPPIAFVIVVEKPAVLIDPPPVLRLMVAILFVFAPDVSSGMFADSTKVPFVASTICPPPVLPAAPMLFVKPWPVVNVPALITSVP